MTNDEMEIAIQFFMSRLSENELAELDAQLAGKSEPVAQDAKRREWIALDSRARIAARKARHDRVFGTPADRERMAAMFPHANRLK